MPLAAVQDAAAAEGVSAPPLAAVQDAAAAEGVAAPVGQPIQPLYYLPSPLPKPASRWKPHGSVAQSPWPLLCYDPPPAKASLGRHPGIPAAIGRRPQ
eukprot:CAMPEP_0115157254 /NCGR_PEP_ID=MMETSP0227-20121206/68949_1 /TAXON_ID=89957 /ORGANISM="Polarella glacialis, Strain CCMP 1383" /LENGTH=97 /DNA_ID=CAMNT_0002568623 /DNA_START=597 /DNA_END=890 /DNA_ORIENTATION=+